MLNLKSLGAAATLVSAAIVIAPVVQAQTMSCDEIQFTGEVLQQFPEVADHCLDVVQRGGEKYAHFTAQFERRTGSSIVLRFKDRNGDLHKGVSIKPPEGQRVKIGGRSYRIRDLNRGAELNIYVPPDRWSMILFDTNEEFVAAPTVTEHAIEEPEPAPAPLPVALPSTASPMPLIGLLGGLFAGIGAGLGWLRLRAARRN